MYLVVLVGPSIGSTKAKVVFAVDGLETKVWGTRDDSHKEKAENDELDEDVDASGIEDGEEDEDADSGIGEDSDEAEDSDTDDDQGYVSDNDLDDAEDVSDAEPSNEEASPPPSRSPTPPPHPSYTSHAEQERTLHAAERLFSRTLATADAEGDGMSADMGISYSTSFRFPC